MYLTKKYKLKSWYGFDDDVYKAACNFVRKKDVFPNIVAFNKHTYEQICFIISNSPKRNQITDDDGKAEIEISKFAFLDCTMHCGYTVGLKDKEFELIYDDETDYDDGDDNPEELIDDPVLEKEFIYA